MNHRALSNLTVVSSLLLFFGLSVAACGDSGTDGSGDCGDDEVQVEYIGGDNERSECAPIPAACNGTAACAEQACISALYDLCESPYIGVGCSDTAPPTIVSCNP